MDMFYKAGDLPEKESIDKAPQASPTGYFVKAGDLSTEEPQKLENLNPANYFVKAGDLPEKESVDKASQARPTGYFVKAGGLSLEEPQKLEKLDPVKIQAYLDSISSGEPLPRQDGVILNGGERFVSLEKLMEMVEKGDNIISAKYFEGMGQVLVRFESLVEDQTMHR